MHGKALFVVIVKSKTKMNCMLQQTDCLIGVQFNSQRERKLVCYAKGAKCVPILNASLIETLLFISPHLTDSLNFPPP